MIHQVSDVVAMAFMSLFPEMRGDEHWDKLCSWVGAGKKTPMLHIGVFDNGLVGLFPCEAYEDRLMIHACFLPGFRGDFAVESAKEAFKWIWNNTEYGKITAYIEPEHVKRYAKRCGMVESGGFFEVSR